MGFPIGTKVYLENKTLKNIEDLQFGDKVLSIKIKNSENLNPSEFYYKYITSKTTPQALSIKNEDVILCSATVYSVFVDKNFINSSFNSLNDKRLLSTNPILIQTDFESGDMYLKNVNNIINILISDQSLQHFIKSLDPNHLNIDRSFLETKIDSFNLNITEQSFVSLELLDNYFFLTEDFICFSDLMIKDYKL
jgi:hypothetical protein